MCVKGHPAGKWRGVWDGAGGVAASSWRRIVDGWERMLAECLDGEDLGW